MLARSYNLCLFAVRLFHKHFTKFQSPPCCQSGNVVLYKVGETYFSSHILCALLFDGRYQEWLEKNRVQNAASESEDESEPAKNRYNKRFG